MPGKAEFLIYVLPHRRCKDDLTEPRWSAQLREHVRVLQWGTRYSVFGYTVKIQDPGQYGGVSVANQREVKVRI